MDWSKLPTITTSRLALRALTFDDVDDFFAVYSDVEVMRYWSTPPLPNREAARDLINEIHEGFKNKQFMKWGMALRSNDKVIGSVTLFHPDFTHRRVELGYALGREFWRQGYMKESLEALLNYAFDVLNFHRIEADVDPRNVASIAILERLGFQREGYLRERWQVNGEIQDAIFYGLLRPEWERANPSSTQES